MQIPIINGIYTTPEGDYRIALPRNYIPIIQSNGISGGYLKPFYGIEVFALGSGIDRGGINWNGICYRVLGNDFVSIDRFGSITIHGSIVGVGPVIFDYSFDYLAVASSGLLYYWDGVTLTQVTDTDLGSVIDFIWLDGYFMATDGENLIVTELSNPFSVNPLKYGSSEINPDPIKAILKLRNEPYALNRYTIEAFQNIGGTGFPFQRIDGAQITRGTIGTHSCIIYMEAIAFLGGSLNEPVSVWIASGGQCTKLASREIDLLLRSYPENALERVVFNVMVDKNSNLLLIHLPDRTIVYDSNASQKLGESVWFILNSGLSKNAQYRGLYPVWVYEKWIVGDPKSNNIGQLTDNVMTHWGEPIEWEFSTTIIYNESNGAIINELELVGLPGNVETSKNPCVYTSWSLDGLNWSQEKEALAGKTGQTNKRIKWYRQGWFSKTRIQKFRGNSDCNVSYTRLEAKLESLER